jgi:nucleotide-binding universal stress UspA family protein
MLASTRDAFAKDARIAVEADASVAVALERVVARERHDLLVVGSSRHATEGHLRIGKRTRQLIAHAGCALGVAPRGMHHHAPMRIARIGVGYDPGPESEAALALAASLARSADAALCVRAVVDDRGVPPIDWSPIGGPPPPPERDRYVRADLGLLREKTVDTVTPLDPDAEIEVQRGRPADVLLDLAASVDLIVVGSRRWGPVARLLLGSTGEALLHDAPCSVIVVPRPAA